MPGLKRLFRLSKQKQEDVVLPVEEEKSPLKRANARLHKRNRSSVNVQSALGVVHNSLPIRDGFQPSRQNSFEPGQSVKDFDAVAPGFDGDEFNFRETGLKAPLCNIFKSRPKTAVEPSSLDLVSAPYPSANVADAAKAAKNRRIVGRYGLEVHPNNIGLARRDGEPDESFSSFDLPAASSQPKLKLHIVNGAPEDDLDSPESSKGPKEIQDNYLKVGDKRRVPSIRDIDWNNIGNDEVRDIAKAYGAARPMSAEGVSPADSAIALPPRERNPRYSGKGKGRQSDRLSASTVSEVIDVWQDFSIHSRRDAADNGCHSDGESGRRSKRKVRRSASSGILETHSAPEIRLNAMADAVEFANQQVEEHSKLLARAREIELEEKRKQEDDDRIEAQRLEEQWRIQEEEALEKLDEQILEQLIKDIEEEEQRAEERRLEVERLRQKECCVCGDSKEPTDFPAKAPTGGCEHRPGTCKECLQSWMSSELDTKGCDGIKCPECTQTLEYNEVQEAASAETFAKYDKLTIRNVLGDLDEFAWCLKPECGSGQLNIDNNHFMDCVSCGYKQCLNHKVAWHSGETCEAYDYRVSGEKKRDEERKEQQMLDTLSKKCPGVGCGWRIQKIDGCEHMTCKKCKFQFCWLCLASHEEIKRVGNTAHASDCKFHSTNLDLAWPFNMH